MAEIDLEPFGFDCTVDLCGTIQVTRREGARLLFLFGERHTNVPMIRRNVENARELVERGVVGCVGTEGLLRLEHMTHEEICTRREKLFEGHQDASRVLDYLQSPGAPCTFQFGSTIKLLYPSLNVRCVEDQGLYSTYQPIHDQYACRENDPQAHPFPDYPNEIDHPHNRRRESAMMDNLLRLWGEQPCHRAAVLNTGSSHTPYLCELAASNGLQYIRVCIPEN